MPSYAIGTIADGGIGSFRKVFNVCSITIIFPGCKQVINIINKSRTLRKKCSDNFFLYLEDAALHYSAVFNCTSIWLALGPVPVGDL